MGSIFSADAWNNITFTAGEVKNPRRDVPLSLALGTAIVITLYFLANVAYLSTLPLAQIQTAPDDRVATAVLSAMLGGAGAAVMAVAITISTFGCANGLILAGARVYYAMARDGLFFRSVGRLNDAARAFAGADHSGYLGGGAGAGADPPRGRGRGGELRQSLQRPARLRGVCGADLLRAHDCRRYSCCAASAPMPSGPIAPLAIRCCPRSISSWPLAIMAILILYKTQTTWPGLVIVLLGVPVYLIWSRQPRAKATSP